MILNIYQTKTSFNMKWEIYDINNTGFAVAESPFEKGQFQVFIQYNNGEQRLYYNPMDVTGGTKLADRMSFKLFEAGEKIGNIVGKTKKRVNTLQKELIAKYDADFIPRIKALEEYTNRCR